ncbi:MAG: 4Fe-4S binding protein [Eubacteriaceae bacterium]|nr:4Fe-4S binding protein [Eubacteriaceae bacterium]
MSIYSIYFSPTGGTEKVCDIISATFSKDYKAIELIAAEDDFASVKLTQDDIAIIGGPVYGGRIPGVAMERLEQISGGGAKAVLVAVYGNRAYDDALMELKDGSVRAGFVPVAGIAANAEHSIARTIAAGRPDKDDEVVLKEFVEKIKEKIAKGETGLEVPGNSHDERRKDSAMPIMVTEDCNECGSCVDECPTRAIPSDAPNTTDAEKCMGCMRCISICPNEARCLPKERIEGATQMLMKACPDRSNNELFL